LQIFEYPKHNSVFTIDKVQESLYWNHKKHPKALLKMNPSKPLLLVFTLFLMSTALQAQLLTGKLQNKNGEPLAYVTIYSPTAKKGTNSNVNGTFELKLPLGKQQVVFQSIDYKSVVKELEIVSGSQELNLTMEEQTYELKEVQVKTGKENPAHYIMKKAIAAAPYYRRQVLSYKAKVYVKGTGRVDESPRLLKGLIAKQGIEVGRSYLTESLNELEFRQPNTYKEKVISLKTTMPFDDAPQPMRMARGSLYDVGDAESEQISPLSPRAFSVYNFYLEGSFYENGYEVNKIRFEPKRRGNDVSSGTLFIIEKLWCMHSCVIEQEQAGMLTTVKTSFKPMAEYPFVWMPVTYDIKAVGSFMGIKGSFRYLASLSNYQIKLNPNVSHDWAQKAGIAPKMQEENSVRTEKKEYQKTKNQQAIEALLAKENLSKREMLTLASKMKAESEMKANKGVFEDDSSEIVVDSLALKQDSSFWVQNRPVALMQDENISYAIQDTQTRKPTDSLNKKTKVALSDVLIFGNNHYNKKKERYFKYQGLFARPYLNTVEGLGFQTQYTYAKTTPKGWLINQTIKVPIERWLPQSQLTLARFYVGGRYALKAGVLVSDYNNKGIDQYTDAFQLLFLKQNFSKLIQQEFVSFDWSQELHKNLKITLRGAFYNRFGIDNIDRYQRQVGNSTLSSNSVLGNNPNQKSYQLGMSIWFRPFQQYQMKNNRKIALKNRWPGIQADYTEAYGTALQFRKVELTLDQNLKVFHWLELFYEAKGGYFFNATNVHLADYFHFAGNQSFVYIGEPKRRFQQLPYYSYSTSSYYKSAFVELSFKKLLFKHLPYLNLLDFKEQVYVNYLHTHEMPFYYETGYRINELLNRVSLGVNIGFSNNVYQSTGFYMSIKLQRN
jgi:hypothetical protein